MQRRYEPIKTKPYFPDGGWGGKEHFDRIQWTIQRSRMKIENAEKTLAAPDARVEGFSDPDITKHALAKMNKSFAEDDIKKAHDEAKRAVKDNQNRAIVGLLRKNPEWLFGG